MTMSEKKRIVVIDGPSGAGKSTVGQRLARRLGYFYLDTGALYRCVALAADQKGLRPAGCKPDDSKKLFQFVKSCKIRFKRRKSRQGAVSQQVFLNGKDVTKHIRTAKISLLASRYSRLPMVRRALRYQQRNFGKKGGMVAEGRDLGTVVFPKAHVKFFMVASVEERARRRYLELKQKFKSVSLKDVRRAIIVRDRADRGRRIAPLKKAKDAIAVDTTALTIDQVVDEMYNHFQRKS